MGIRIRLDLAIRRRRSSMAINRALSLFFGMLITLKIGPGFSLLTFAKEMVKFLKWPKFLFKIFIFLSDHFLVIFPNAASEFDFKNSGVIFALGVFYNFHFINYFNIDSAFIYFEQSAFFASNSLFCLFLKAKMLDLKFRFERIESFKSQEGVLDSDWFANWPSLRLCWKLSLAIKTLKPFQTALRAYQKLSHSF